MICRLRREGNARAVARTRSRPATRQTPLTVTGTSAPVRQNRPGIGTRAKDADSRQGHLQISAPPQNCTTTSLETQALSALDMLRVLPRVAKKAIGEVAPVKQQSHHPLNPVMRRMWGIR
jgi:hypothetical protein